MISFWSRAKNCANQNAIKLRSNRDQVVCFDFFWNFFAIAIKCAFWSRFDRDRIFRRKGILRMISLPKIISINYWWLQNTINSRLIYNNKIFKFALRPELSTLPPFRFDYMHFFTDWPLFCFESLLQLSTNTQMNILLTRICAVCVMLLVFWHGYMCGLVELTISK